MRVFNVTPLLPPGLFCFPDFITFVVSECSLHLTSWTQISSQSVSQRIRPMTLVPEVLRKHIAIEFLELNYPWFPIQQWCNCQKFKGVKWRYCIRESECALEVKYIKLQHCEKSYYRDCRTSWLLLRAINALIKENKRLG